MAMTSTIPKKRILIADSQLFNMASLIGACNGHYLVVTATSAAQVSKELETAPVAMILLDPNLADKDGFSLCQQLKSDQRYGEIPVIFISADNKVTEEARAFEVGAVDYIRKPFYAPTLLARIGNQIRLSEAIRELKQLNRLALDANPNTGLPGNNSIQQEIGRLLDSRELVCVIYADLDYFKAYNDKYGFARGDEVIVFCANIIRVALQQHGCADAFVGHIGGDDFVFVVPTDKCAQVSQEIVRRMNTGIGQFYRPQDLERGFVTATNREGHVCNSPLISLSMGGVDLSKSTAATVLEVIDRCTEMKGVAKAEAGSNLKLCQRRQ